MKNGTILLAGIIIIKFILQYTLIDPVYELHRDEYLHLDQGRHLAWGYFSVPPFTSWISKLILLLGGGTFWVKFFPALFGALTIWIVWKTIEALGGGLFARALGAVSVLFSVVLRINILFQPNSADIFFWTLIYYLLVRYIQSGKTKWIYWAAIAFGFAFLNKYNIVFLVAAIIPAGLLTEHRKLFLRKELYFAILLALLIISPNLYWQYQNNFPVFRHMKELADTQLVNMNRMDFIKEQLMFFAGSFFVIIAALLSFFTFPPFRSFRIIFWSFVFAFLVFVYLKAKGYYAIGLYPVLIAFGAVYIENLVKGRWRFFVRPLALAIPAFLFFPMVRIAFPIYTPEEIEKDSKTYEELGLLRWEDGKQHHLPQDFADMLGWKELAAKVDQAYSRLPGKDNNLVLCDNYGQAGAINYYSGTKNINALSLNADYINWIPADSLFKNVILVKDADDTDPQRLEEQPHFAGITLYDSIENRFAREKGTRIYILRKADSTINDKLQAEILQRKKRWSGKN